MCMYCTGWGIRGSVPSWNVYVLCRLRSQRINSGLKCSCIVQVEEPEDQFRPEMFMYCVGWGARESVPAWKFMYCVGWGARELVPAWNIYVFCRLRSRRTDIYLTLRMRKPTRDQVQIIKRTHRQRRKERKQRISH